MCEPNRAKDAAAAMNRAYAEVAAQQTVRTYATGVAQSSGRTIRDALIAEIDRHESAARATRELIVHPFQARR
jgi:hypothetical protein